MHAKQFSSDKRYIRTMPYNRCLALLYPPCFPPDGAVSGDYALLSRQCPPDRSGGDAVVPHEARSISYYHTSISVFQTCSNQQTSPYARVRCVRCAWVHTPVYAARQVLPTRHACGVARYSTVVCLPMRCCSYLLSSRPPSLVAGVSVVFHFARFLRPRQ